MTLFLLFVLVLTHQQTQLVQALAYFSVALPLLVRSPYFSCWLPQINTSDPSISGFSSENYQGTTTSNLSQVRVLSSFDLTELRYL
jgi:hypothetical protein